MAYPRWFHPVVALSLAVAAMIAIASTLPGIDMGGDAAWKWAFVRSWGKGLPWVYDHHTARFAINVPAYLCQRIFGTGPNVMYVAPIAFALTQIALCYAVGRRLGGVAVGVVSALCLIGFGPWRGAASQLLPGVFQSTYLLFAVYAFVRFSARPRRFWLAAVGGGLFAGYLAMLSTLYFVPGFVVATFLVRRRALDVATWLGLLLLGIALETGLYALLSDFPGGQLQIVQRSHNNVEPIAFWGLFSRYAALPLSWQVALSVGAACAALLLVLGSSAALRGLPLIAGAFIMASTFMVKNLHPLVPALNFRDRYFDPIAPLVALMLPTTIALLLRRWRVRPRLQLQAADALLLVVLLSAAASGLLVWQHGFAAPRVLAENAASSELVSGAFRSGQPIIGDNGKAHDQVKTLFVVALAFFDDEAFGAQRDVRRPRMYNVQVGKRRFKYLAKSPLSDEQAQRAARKKSCAVFVARVPGAPKLIAHREGPCS
jgi:hypothetical protein